MEKKDLLKLQLLGVEMGARMMGIEIARKMPLDQFEQVSKIIDAYLEEIKLNNEKQLAA